MSWISCQHLQLCEDVRHTLAFGNLRQLFNAKLADFDQPKNGGVTQVSKEVLLINPEIQNVKYPTMGLQNL